MKVFYPHELTVEAFQIVGYRKVDEDKFGFCSYPYPEVMKDFQDGLVELECFSEELDETFILKP